MSDDSEKDYQFKAEQPPNGEINIDIPHPETFITYGQTRKSSDIVWATQLVASPDIHSLTAAVSFDWQKEGTETELHIGLDLSFYFVSTYDSQFLAARTQEVANFLQHHGFQVRSSFEALNGHYLYIMMPETGFLIAVIFGFTDVTELATANPGKPDVLRDYLDYGNQVAVMNETALSLEPSVLKTQVEFQRQLAVATLKAICDVLNRRIPTIDFTIELDTPV